MCVLEANTVGVMKGEWSQFILNSTDGFWEVYDLRPVIIARIALTNTRTTRHTRAAVDGVVTGRAALEAAVFLSNFSARDGHA